MEADTRPLPMRGQIQQPGFSGQDSDSQGRAGSGETLLPSVTEDALNSRLSRRNASPPGDWPRLRYRATNSAQSGIAVLEGKSESKR